MSQKNLINLSGLATFHFNQVLKVIWSFYFIFQSHFMPYRCLLFIAFFKCVKKYFREKYLELLLEGSFHLKMLKCSLLGHTDILKWVWMIALWPFKVHLWGIFLPHIQGSSTYFWCIVLLPRSLWREGEGMCWCAMAEKMRLKAWHYYRSREVLILCGPW